MNPNPTGAPQKSGGSKTVLILVLVAVAVSACCVVGILAAIAVPNFIKYQQKAKQSEVKHTLKLLLTHEETYLAKEGTWAITPRQLIEIAPNAPRNYTCFLAPEASWGGKGNVSFDKLPPGVQGRLTENLAAVEAQKQKTPAAPGVEADFVIACAANLDKDEALDVWTISASDPTPRMEQEDFGN